MVHDPSSNSSIAEIFIVPLDKQYVPVSRNNRTVMHKTAYFGKVFVGLPHPQVFTVVFDTGSGHFFVPSSKCNSEPCAKHRRYDRSYSESAVDIDHDGAAVNKNISDRDQVAIEFGTGKVTGDFAHEVVCMSDHIGKTYDASMRNSDCTRLRVVFATEMTVEPFQAFNFDGVLGLGLESLALDPEFSFFAQMTKLNHKMEPRFGVFISRSDYIPSEIAFGGYDRRRAASDLEWVPVLRPELGYWQVKLHGVKVAGEVLDICETGDCVAIFDTGTSLLGAPQQALQHMHWLLARKVTDRSGAGVDCRNYPGPEVVFDLGGAIITLGPEDYSRPAALQLVNKDKKTQVICRASLLPVDENPTLGMKTWILGEPVLRKYYTVYDWGEKHVGFAQAVQPSPDSSAAPAHDVFGAPPMQVPTPTTVQI